VQKYYATRGSSGDVEIDTTRGLQTVVSGQLILSIFFFNICGSVRYQSILLKNQRDAALSSRIYSSLRGYSTCFGCFLHPSSGVQLKL
jgi:hypothetical protein